MNRLVLTRGLQSCMLGAALAGGCASPQAQVAHQGSDLLPPASSWTQQGARPATPATTAIPTAKGTVVQAGYVVNDRPAAAAPAATEAALPPVVYADKSASPMDSNAQATTMPAPASPNQPASAKLVVVDQRSSGTLEAVKVDIDAPGHAPDYSWLVGQVQYTRLSKAWRLRYASMSETDPYGGSVTLAEDSRLAHLKDGDMVRVEGHLLNATSRSIAPAYVIHSLEVQTH